MTKNTVKKYVTNSKHKILLLKSGFVKFVSQFMIKLKNFSSFQNLAPIVPILAGTVLPAGTSTDGFIHHDNANGLQTHHAMAVQPNSPVGLKLSQPTQLLPAQQNLFTPQQNTEPVFVNYQPIQQILQSPHQPQTIPQVSTVLSPTLPGKYQQEQNLYLSPNGGVKYSSNVGGDNSKSFVQVELGNQNPDHVVNSQLNAGGLVYNPVNFGQVIQEGQKGILLNQPSFVNIQQGARQDRILNNGQVVSGGSFVQEISEGIDNEAENDYLLTTQVNGQYGEKLLSSSYQNNKGNVQLGRNKVEFVPKQNVFVSSTTQIPIISSSTFAPRLKQNKNVFTKLVESTQNLVSNEDLLSINGAAEQEEQNQNAHSADSYSFNEHQHVVNIRPTQSIVALRGTLSVGDSNLKPPTGAGIVSIERDQNFQYGQEKGSPIIVPDFDYDYNNNEVSSTQSSISAGVLQNVQQGVQVNNIFSTTQSTVETDVTRIDYVTEQTYTKPLDSTIVVTPRPVSQKFLAPLTAGLSLVSSNNVEKYLDCAHTEKTTDVKFVEDDVIEQENEDNKAINRELKKQLTQIYNEQTKSTDNNQIQYPSALEESKKIQVNSNQQLYQLGAQQVLIHPAEQQNQLAAEEISQQYEESQGESIKQESQQQHQNQQQQIQINYQNEQNQQQQIYQNEQIQQQQQNYQNQQHQQVQQQQYPKQQILQQAHVQNHQLLVQNQQDAIQTVQNVDSNYNSDYNQEFFKTHRQVADQQVIGCNDDYSQISSTNPPVVLQYTQSNGHLFNGGQTNQQNQHQQIQSHQPQYFYISQQQESQHQQNHGTVGINPAHIQYQPYLLYGTPQRITLQQMRQNLGVSYSQDESEKQIVEVKVPYPIEKIVEKVIDRPVEVTRYVDKPYPVEKRIPYPVQVEKIIEKQVPYPVEVKVPYKVEVPYPVEKIVEKQVRYPVHINVPYPVEKIVERPVEVTKYIEKPYPVEKRVPYPVHVDRIVEKQVPYPVEIKVPYKVEVERPVPFNVEKIVNRPYAVIVPSHIQQNQNQNHGQIQSQWNQGWQSGHNQHQQNQVFYRNRNHISVEQPKYSRPASSQTSDSGYTYNKPSVSFNTPSHESKQASQQHSSYSQYLGPVPLKSSTDSWNYGGLHHNENSLKFRRSERTLQGFRLEYGFKPPLIPSLEIDLNGHPVKREV